MKRDFLSFLPKAASETTKPVFYLLFYSQKMADCFCGTLIFKVKICSTVHPRNFCYSLSFFPVHFEFLGIKYLFCLLLKEMCPGKFELSEGIFLIIFSHPQAAL